MIYSSKLIEEAVEAFSSLPSIGKKTALRLVLHLLNQPEEKTAALSEALTKFRKNIKICTRCCNVSDTEVCEICRDTRRDQATVCVVESIRDVMAIESTGQYRGLYHVLGGVISPIEGIGPGELNIDHLVQRIDKEEINEVVMAISPNIEGDTTVYYIAKRLKDKPVKISAIARGISFGGELEYADEVTLGRSIQSRIPYRMHQD